MEIKLLLDTNAIIALLKGNEKLKKLSIPLSGPLQ
jgi:hypothetical protein